MKLNADPKRVFTSLCQTPGDIIFLNIYFIRSIYAHLCAPYAVRTQPSTLRGAAAPRAVAWRITVV